MEYMPPDAMSGMGPMHMEMMPPPTMAGMDADMMGNMPPHCIWAVWVAWDLQWSICHRKLWLGCMDL